MHPAPYLRPSGQDWLLSCADTPAEIRALWDADELGDFPTGGHWTAGETSLARTMDAIKTIPAEQRGPVLADCHQGIAWWLLPPTLAVNSTTSTRSPSVRAVGSCAARRCRIRCAAACGSSARTAPAGSPTLSCSALRSVLAAGPDFLWRHSDDAYFG
ncbi:hypothetical protein [Streptomyces sp. NPDC058305]|uniref:hypothetical protein n=1 Tax=Streptomyces sp. NPDC058305 TaxID=3346438 RepID=UPI0036E709A3